MTLRDWLRRNADLLEAAGAIATAFAALAALVVIPWQIAQADRIQRDQTAREIYREFLNLTVHMPELATANYCTPSDPNQIAAYSAYVDYLLYTADQMIETSPSWRGTMASYLGSHMAYLRSPEVQGDNGDVAGLVADLGLICKPQHRCLQTTS